MTDADAIARYVFLAKEQKSLSTHRSAVRKVLKEANVRYESIRSIIKGTKQDIQKTTNMMCLLDGERNGLKQMMSEEARAQVKQIISETDSKEESAIEIS